LEDVIISVPTNDNLFIGEDLNDHVGTTNIRFEGVHGGFKYGDINRRVKTSWTLW
jgi:hypothetical protein